MVEQGKTSIEGLKSTENTSPLDGIITIDNPESKAKIEDIYRGLDKQKQVLFVAKLQENQGKLEMFQDAPDDIVALLTEILNEINKQEVAVEKQEVAVEKQEVAVEKQEVAKRKEEKMIETTEVLKKTREQLEKTYALFGGKEKFKQIQGHEHWKEQATIRVQKEATEKGEELSEDELATRVETSIILSHQEAIKSTLPPDKQKVFAGLCGELRGSAKFLNIPYETTLADEPHTRGTENKITTELLDFKSGDKVIKVGSEYRFGDQIVDVSKIPPERSIEKNGIRVVMPDKDGTKEEHYQKQQEYREHRGSLTQEIATLSDYLETNREKMQEKYLKLPEMKRDRESAPGGSRDREELDILIQKTEQELTEFKQKTERLAMLKESLALLKKEEESRNALYQKTLQQETESSRSNLTFLSSTHLDGILRNDGIQTLIREIDLHRDTFPVDTLDKASSLSLDKEWKEPEKKLFAAGISRLLGMEGEKSKQLFLSDGYTMRAVAPDGRTPMERFLKDRLTSQGIYESGKIPPVTEEGVKKGMTIKVEGREVDRLL